MQLLFLFSESWGTQCIFLCVCPPSLESLFLPVLWKSCDQIPLAFKVRFPGDSQRLCQIRWLGSLTWGSEPLQQWRTSLVLFFYSLWVTHLVGIRFHFIVLCPSYHLAKASLSLNLGIFFFFLVGSSVLLSMVA